MVGAIVIVGPEMFATLGNSVKAPLACVEILGQSVMERIAAELKRTDVDEITLLADGSLMAVRSEIEQATRDFTLRWTDDAWAETSQLLKSYRQAGVERALIVRVSAYAELDWSDLRQFHGAQNRDVTRAFDPQGPLDYWIIETAAMTDSDDVRPLLAANDVARCPVSGYVRRLEHPRDLRRLVADSLMSRCRLRPRGSEIRTGVWMEEGAQVHRKARIVAPAFLGRGSKIEEQCLITRCTNVESNSCVDYGTVVEDSSILSNSYVGIGLDIAHCIVDGSSLLSLKRDVVMEIADPGLIKRTRKEMQQSLALGLKDSTVRAPDVKGVVQMMN